jgi:hypothetical protein
VTPFGQEHRSVQGDGRDAEEDRHVPDESLSPPMMTWPHEPCQVGNLIVESDFVELDHASFPVQIWNIGVPVHFSNAAPVIVASRVGRNEVGAALVKEAELG